MRIALVSPYPTAGSSPVGGVEVATARLARALRAHGEDVTIVALTGTQNDADGGVRVVRLGIDGRWSSLRDLGPLRRALAAALQSLPADVVHAQDLVPAGYAAARVAAAAIPTVVTAHGNRRQDTLAAYRGIGGQLRWILGRRMTRWAAGHADAVVGVHPDPRLSVPVTPRRFEYIPNVVEERFFAVERRPEPARVLFCGGTRRIKGLDLLLEAWPLVLRRFPHARLHAPGCREVVAQLPAALAESIDAGDWLDVEGLARALARAAVAVLPSRFDLAPTALSEAWAARVPVVATAVGGVPVLAYGAARLVEPNPARIASELVLAVADPEVSAALVDEGHRRAQEHRAFRVADAHLSLYRSLIAA